MSQAEDLTAIRQLVDAYAVAIDRRDGDAFVSLFVAGGGMRVFAGGRAKPVAEFLGADQLRALCEQTHDACHRTFHFVGNHVCRIDGDGAVGDTYCIAHHLMDADEPGEARVDETMLVHYEDRYVRTAEGWRIAERRAHRRWSNEHPAVSPPLRVDRALGDALRA